MILVPIMELEKQGQKNALSLKRYTPVFPIIFISNGEYREAQLGSKVADRCDIVDYHKEKSLFGEVDYEE